MEEEERQQRPEASRRSASPLIPAPFTIHFTPPGIRCSLKNTGVARKRVCDSCWGVVSSSPEGDPLCSVCKTPPVWTSVSGQLLRVLAGSQRVQSPPEDEDWCNSLFFTKTKKDPEQPERAVQDFLASEAGSGGGRTLTLSVPRSAPSLNSPCWVQAETGGQALGGGNPTTSRWEPVGEDWIQSSAKPAARPAL